ncbi:cytochrome P450 monooxygenase apf7 [Colletotrichum spaethianum]|uniref:Cytochrome P450 monooxygenase apf7 n=1 Tax=Colletotrichum spaethianum TaxID=700344 RepID=A0AA37PEH8_9PEZI|nr:cytochrome P450 monooxygenase apf7 [Colletotrichum spaethianum]GKT50620.1 cytochrome P450 monooxygenase apf7 [Colletotrichum spaethianum]
MAPEANHVWLWLGFAAVGGVIYNEMAYGEEPDLTEESPQVAGIVVYRLFFHPLAKYPGPFIAKITDGYQLYHAWKGDRHLDFYKLHSQYGAWPTLSPSSTSRSSYCPWSLQQTRTVIVRFGPNSLSFNSSTSLKEIYGFRSNVRKAEFYNAFVHPAPNTHNARDKDVHARKRRVLAHGFSDSAMKEMERYIIANVRSFTTEIGRGAGPETKGWSTPKNMADWCNYLAMDILGDLSFGKAFHMLEAPDNRFALDLIAAATKRHLLCGTMPIVDKLKLDRLLFPTIAAGRARYMAYSKAQLTERTKLGEDTDRRDFFYYLLKARDPETGLGFSVPELWGESNLLTSIIAGSDTTSTAMAATLFYIVRNAAALEKATAEVRSKFADVEEIRQGATLNTCTYLRACIDEAMRLSPSVGGLLPREVLAGGMTIDGAHVPAGTIVGTPHYTIHHNEAYYPSAYAYVPERWIVGARNPTTGRATTEEDTARAQSAFCPFSVGARGCIGKGLAYAEMSTTLARTLFLYDLRKAVGVVDPAEGRPELEGGGGGRGRCSCLTLLRA